MRPHHLLLLGTIALAPGTALAVRFCCKVCSGWLIG